jgi:hypothetical protein
MKKNKSTQKETPKTNEPIGVTISIEELRAILGGNGDGGGDGGSGGSGGSDQGVT